MWYLGVDPGASGGIGAVDENGNAFAHRMPMELNQLQQLLAIYSEDLVFCLIEKIAIYPKGLLGNRVIRSGFDKLARQAGIAFATASLILGEARVGEVLPRKWQRGMFCLTHGDKRITRQRAIELFPSTRVTHFTADSLLIAEYCRRLHGPRNSEYKDWRGV